MFRYLCVILSILNLFNDSCNNLPTVYKDKQLYDRIFTTVRELNVKLSFVEQDKPSGIPDAILQTKSLRRDREAIVILGDNIFVGNDFRFILVQKSN